MRNYQISPIYLCRITPADLTCSVCEETSHTTFVGAVSSELEGADAPPGLYDELGFICDTCVVSPSIAISRLLPLIEPLAREKRFHDLRYVLQVLDFLEATKSTGFLPLAPDAILLPVPDGEDVELQDGRWHIVPISTAISEAEIEAILKMI